jgi:hypothetical protein
MKGQTFAAGVIVMALAAPVLAQGNGNGKAKGHGNGAPPSRNELAPVAVVTPVVSATPLAWIDDATLLDPDTMVLSLSAVRWQGAGLSEVDFPISDVAMGLARRVQLSASVPRVIGSADPGGAAGGVGTSFFSFKVGVASNRARTMKLAVAPTMQLLGEAVAATLGPNQSRVRWGLPVSAEIDRGPLRLYGGGGYFSPGLWYTGAAFGLQTSPKMTINGGFSRAWRGANGLDIPLSDRDRKEISGGAACSLTPHLTAFGSIGTTVKTFDDNGAGTTLSGGVSFWFATVSR